MIGTVACVATGATVYMILTAILHPASRPEGEPPSDWALTRQSVRAGLMPSGGQLMVLCRPCYCPAW